MSTEVDKRIVEMQFKNDQFEKGAKTSMDTVEKLKKSLNFDGAADGLKKLGTNAKNVSLDSLAASVEQISSRFSTMGIIGMTALQNITNSAINAGKQMLESLTIAPIKQGFEEYQLQMDSVQTIMAGTGESLQTVTKYLDELNTYADKTIYSFSDMTSNIGKFTNAGVSLNQAVKAIQGISNEAAVSGANAQQASHAMYNFAQALSAGYVKLIDWKSIENANMATKEFKEQLISTAVSMGTLTDAGDGMYSTLNGHTLNAIKDFNDSLKDEWMTTDVLVETLGRYSDETTEIGKKAFAAAQDVKTFKQLMDTLQEAAGSGWAQTWKIIIGDFDDAKDLFTKMSEEFGGIIQKMADARNDLLEGALGNFSKYADKNWHEVHDALQTSQQEFMSAPLWSWMDKRVHTNAAYRQGLLEAAEAAGKLTKVEDGLYSTGKHLISATSSSSQWMASLTDNWLTSTSAAEGLRKAVGDVNKEMARDSGRDLLIGSFKNIWNSLKSIFGAIRDGFRTIFPKMGSETLYKIIEGFNKLTNALKPSPEVLNKLKRTFAGFFAIIDIIIQPLKFFANIIIDLVKFFAPAGEGILELTANLGDFLVSLDKAIKDSGAFTTALEALRDAFTPIGEGIKWFVGFIKDLIKALYDWSKGNDHVSETLEKATDKTNKFAKAAQVLVDIGKVFYAIGSGIKNFFLKIWEGMKWLWNLPFVKKNIKRFGDAFSKVFENIKASMGPTSKAFEEFVERIKAMDGLSMENIGTAIKDFVVNVMGTFFSGIFESLAPLGEAFVGFFSDLFDKISNALHSNDKLKPLADIFDKIREFFASLVKSKDVDKGVSTLDSFSNGLGRFSDHLGGIADEVGPVFEKIGGFLTENFPAILTVLTGIGIIRGIKRLADLGDAFVEGVRAIANGITSLGMVLKGASQVVTNFGKLIKATAFKTYADAIFKIVEAIAILVGTVIALTFFDTDKLWNSVTVLGVLVGILAGFIFAMNMSLAMLDSYSGVKQLAAMIVLIQSFAAALIEFSLALILAGAAQNVTDSLVAFAGMLGMLIGVIIVLRKICKSSDADIMAIASVMAAFGTSILMLAIAFRVMDGVKDILKDLLVFAGMLGGMLLLVLVIGKMKKDAGIAASTLIAFAGSILMLAIAFRVMDGVKNLETDIAIFAGMVIGLIAFVAAIGAMKSQAKTSAALLLSFAGAVILIASALTIIGTIRPDKLMASLVALMSIMGMLIAVMAVSMVAGKNSARAGILLAGMGTSLLLIAVAMQIIGSMDKNSLRKALECITQVSIIFGVIIFMSIFAGNNAMRAGIMLLAMSAALVILSGVIWILGSLDPGVAARGTLAVMGLMGVMALLIALGKAAQPTVKYIIAITACITTLGVMVAALSMIEPDRLAGATAALDSLVICFAILLKVSDSAKGVNKSIFLIIGAMAALGALIVVLSMFVDDSGKFLQIATGVSLLAVALASAVAILTKIGKVNVAEIAQAGAAMDVLAAEIIGLIAGIGAIFNAIDSFTNGGATAALEKGLEVMTTIADGLGKMIGSFAGSIAEGFSDHMPAIGTNMSQFAENIKPFFDSISGIPDDVTDRMGKIVDAIAVLTGSDFLYSLTQFFGGKSFEEFGDEMSKFASGLKVFLGEISGISDDDLTRIDVAAKAAKALSDAFANMPTEGGALNWLFGETMDIGKFGEQVKKFGEMLIAFSESVSGLSEDDIKSINVAAQAAKGLTDLANSVPNSGGLLGMLAGENDLDSFGDKLVGFGQSLVRFAASCSALTEDDIAKFKLVSEGVTAIIEMSNKMENSGGLLSVFTGDNDLGTLSGHLALFGKGLASFSDSIKSIPKASIDKWKAIADGITPLIEMSKKLQNSGGLLAGIVGDNDLGTFAGHIALFGKGIASFAMSVESLSPQQLLNVQMAAEAAKPLIQLGNDLHMENSGGIFAWITGENDLGTLGQKLGAFGKGISEFASNIGTFDNGTLTNVSNAVYCGKKLVEIGNSSQSIKDFIGIGFDENFASKAGNFAAGMAALSSGLSDFGNDLSTNIGYAASAALSLAAVGDASTSIDSFNNLSLEELEGKATAFSKAMNAFANNLGKFDETVKNNVVHALEVANGLSVVGNSSAGIESFIALELSSFKSQVEIFCDGMNALSDNLTKFSSDDLSIVQNAASAIESIGTMAETAQRIGAEMNLDNFNSQTSTLTARLEDFAAECERILPSEEDINSVLAILDAIVNKVNSAATTFSADSVMALTENLNALADALKSMAGIDGAVVEGFVGAMESLADGTIQGFITKFGNETPNVTEAVSSLLTAIVATMETYKAQFANATLALVNSIKDALNGEKDNLKAAGASMFGAICSGFESGDRTVLANAASSVGSNIVSAVNSNWGAVYSAGQHLMDGLALGIKVGKSWVVNAASEVLNATLTLINTKLQINSPSKVTMKIGKSIDEGLALGMSKNSQMTEKAGGEVVDNALDTMTNSMNKIASLVDGDLDFVPVITPVIDSSMVESGISNINSMFSEQQALKVANIEADVKATNADSDIKELIRLNKAMLTAIRSGGDVYLNENLIIGRINRRLGAL